MSMIRFSRAANFLKLRAGTYPVAGFQPRQFPGLALWTDPFDNHRRTLRYGALFPGGGNSTSYLSCADHADFNVSGGTFSVELWKNPIGLFDNTDAQALSRTFVGQSRDAANSGGWWITSGGSNNFQNYVQCWFATNSDASGLAFAMAPVTTDWSHLVMVYEGSLAAGLRCAIYLDGMLIDKATYTLSGTLPATPQNPTTPPLSIGREGHSAHQDAKDVIGPVRFWPTRALTAGDVTALYNSGSPRYHSEQPDGTPGDLTAIPGITTGLKGSWDCTEDGTSRLDSSGNNHTMAVTGTVARRAVVLRDHEKGGGGFELLAMRNGTPDLTVPHFCAAPHYLPTGINGRPALSYIYNHGMRAAATQPFDYGSCDISHVFKVRAFYASEAWDVSSCRESDDTGYLLCGWFKPAANAFCDLRIRDTGVGIDGNALTDQVLAIDTAYVSNWRVLGTGGAASFEHRLNGVASGITLDANCQNKSFDDILTRANVMRPGIGRTTISLGYIDQLAGEQLIYAPGLTQAQNRIVEQYLALWYGVVLP